MENLERQISARLQWAERDMKRTLRKIACDFSALEWVDRGWYVLSDDGDWSQCGGEQEAHSLAEDCAKDGARCAVVRIDHIYAPEETIVDPCEERGVTPGVDFPATLTRAWGAV